MSLLILGTHVFHQLSFQLVLVLFTPNLSLKVLDKIEAAQEIVLEVPLHKVWESRWPVFALVQGVLDKLIKLLIVVMRIVHRSWAFAFWEAPDLLRHVLWSTLRSFGFRLLHVLFFEVSVLLLIDLLTLVWHVSLPDQVSSQAVVVRGVLDCAEV